MLSLAGVQQPKVDYGPLMAALEESCAELGLQPVPAFLAKVRQTAACYAAGLADLGSSNQAPAVAAMLSQFLRLPPPAGGAAVRDHCGAPWADAGGPHHERQDLLLPGAAGGPLPGC